MRRRIRVVRVRASWSGEEKEDGREGGRERAVTGNARESFDLFSLALRFPVSMVHESTRIYNSPPQLL